VVDFGSVYVKPMSASMTLAVKNNSMKFRSSFIYVLNQQPKMRIMKEGRAKTETRQAQTRDKTRQRVLSKQEVK
jgi:hypothetical protein